MMQKIEYVEAIATALERTDDISLLDLIYQILAKSEQRRDAS